MDKSHDSQVARSPWAYSIGIFGYIFLLNRKKVYYIGITNILCVSLCLSFFILIVCVFFWGCIFSELSKPSQHAWLSSTLKVKPNQVPGQGTFSCTLHVMYLRSCRKWEINFILHFFHFYLHVPTLVLWIWCYLVYHSTCFRF